MKKHNGLITKKDLANYEAVEQKPIHGTYRGYDVYGMSPPSSGGVAIVEMLNILEGFDLKAIGHNSALYIHLLTEAMRTAFADRAEHLGDPAFNPEMPIERLTSKEYADEIRPTQDVDMTINVINLGHWAVLQEKLATLGFHPDPQGHAISSYKYKDIPVDIMSVEDDPLGPANRWYKIGF